jgi:uncharacterized protein YyaL (SSP411 family)
MIKDQSKNIIHWCNWNNESLLRAKNENKPIFLFIESNTSEWSQKMHEESFSSKEISELLNERFIPIRLLAEERSDMERYYQKVYQLMNREATSSPLSIFLTQELEPFYAGSYLSIEEINQQLSFESLLRVISKKYITDYDTLSQKGKEVLEFVNPKEEKIQATKLNLSVINTIKLHATNLLDKTHGGFTKYPKFPNITTLSLLLDVYELEKDEELLHTVTLTLDNMVKGGFYDLENGGFYHYATDEKWSEAYEVKTTYDNAGLSQLYLRAYQLTKNDNYKEVALKTLDFMIEERNIDKLFALKEEKIITSWNALMVNALFKASEVDNNYKIYALETLEALLSNFYLNGMLYHTKEIKAFLEDYVFLGETLVLAYQHTLDESFLIMATQFSNLIIEHYYNQGQWVYTDNEFSIKESTHDRGLPSSLSTALSLIMSISSLIDVNYKKFVFKTLELNSYNLMRQPLSSPKLTEVMLRYLKDDLIIKANRELLEKHIEKRKRIGYPYLLFKTTADENFNLWNSHSKIKSEASFEKLTSSLGK